MGAEFCTWNKNGIFKKKSIYPSPIVDKIPLTDGGGSVSPLITVDDDLA